MTSWTAKKFILTNAYPSLLTAGGRAADPGQVPGEVRRAEGALREGTQGRLLPCQVLGGPQHQSFGREQRLLRCHHHVSFCLENEDETEFSLRSLFFIVVCCLSFIPIDYQVVGILICYTAHNIRQKTLLSVLNFIDKN
jgi:hypothetical protein